MKIGIDIDDVIVEFNKGLLDFYNKKFNKIFEFEKMFDWRLNILFNMSLEEAINFVKEFYDSLEFDKIELIFGAKESIENLAKEHELFFVTARHLSVKEKTYSFIEQVFPKFKKEIIFSSEEWNEGKLKHEICKELGVEVLIEDRGEYALDCAENGIKCFLLDKPWNKKAMHENIIRVNNWNEILNNINGENGKCK